MTTPHSPGSALITGGTTGIGLATARVLHQQGYAVLVTGHNPDTIAAAKRALPDDVVVLRADIRVLADAARVADEIRALPSPLSVVFLNAGIHRMTPIEAVDEEMFDDLFAVNVKGQYFTLQKVLPLLGDGGSVIFNGALGARKGLPGWSIVSATKGALMALVPSLAIELSARRIRVNAVVPGLIRTPVFDKLWPEPDVMVTFTDSMDERVPLGRMGADEDVANLVGFLASPAASYITGACLPIDGGMGVA
jgi:NAD(P)-dependent dehydrogenase (short-subunit alcohol dehydrogenase family)